MSRVVNIRKENNKTMVCIPRELLNVVKCLKLENKLAIEIRNGESPKVKSFTIDDRIEDIKWFIRNKKYVKCGGEIIKGDDALSLSEITVEIKIGKKGMKLNVSSKFNGLYLALYIRYHW